MLSVKELRKSYDYLIFTNFQLVLLWSLAFIGLFFIFRVLEPLVNQLTFIYNDITFYELEKTGGQNPYEMYIPIFESDNQYKIVISLV